MNEWKELEIDNLPSDILTGGYEFEIYDTDDMWDEWILSRYEIFIGLEKGNKYRYRKPEPEPPSHEELQKRIDNTLAYLNCGVVHEYEIMDLLPEGVTL